MTRFKLPFAQFSLAQESKCMAWHKTILNNREENLSAGTITTSDWEEAKERIKKNITSYKIKGV